MIITNTPHNDNATPVPPPPPPPAMVRDAENWAKTPFEALTARHPDRVFIDTIRNEHLEREFDEIAQAMTKGRYRKRKNHDALRRQAMSVLEDEVCDMADLAGLTDYRIKTKLIGREEAPKVKVTIVTREPLEAETIIDLVDLLDDYFESV